jgi:hypothetical protein
VYSQLKILVTKNKNNERKNYGKINNFNTTFICLEKDEKKKKKEYISASGSWQIYTRRS